VLDRSQLGPPDASDPTGDVASVEEKVDKLAAVVHLVWCDTRGEWREFGHSKQHPDTSGKAGAIQARLESELYPTIG